MISCGDLDLDWDWVLFNTTSSTFYVLIFHNVLFYGKVRFLLDISVWYLFKVIFAFCFMVLQDSFFL